MHSCKNSDLLQEIITKDGSRTLYDSQLQVSYRSHYGAKNESQYVFWEGCQLERITDHCTVVELGFGAASNFAQTAMLCRNKGISLEYHSVEHAPVPADRLPDYDWPSELARAALNQVSQNASSNPITVSNGDISLYLYLGNFVEVLIPKGVADGFYFDPFGPKTNPNSWTEEAFAWSKRALKPDGRLATYSAASGVKRALRAAGFEVVIRPGPPPKREVLVGFPKF